MGAGQGWFSTWIEGSVWDMITYCRKIETHTLTNSEPACVLCANIARLSWAEPSATEYVGVKHE